MYVLISRLAIYLCRSHSLPRLLTVYTWYLYSYYYYTAEEYSEVHCYFYAHTETKRVILYLDSFKRLDLRARSFIFFPFIQRIIEVRNVYGYYVREYVHDWVG